MKNLNKKIGAMALAVMVMAGGLGLASASVAHADAGDDIYPMAWYNSDNPKDNDIFIKEFGGWWKDALSGELIEIKDLGKEHKEGDKLRVFKDIDELKKFLEENKIKEGVYLASVKPRAGRESQNLNILFKYKMPQPKFED